MSRIYEVIVEVQETGGRMTNAFLRHGYRLLGVFQSSKPTASYVRQDAVFVVGRTADVLPTTWAQLRAERDAANAVAEQPAATGEQG